MKELLEFLDDIRRGYGDNVDFYDLFKICEKDEKARYKLCEIAFDLESDIKHIKKFLGD